MLQVNKFVIFFHLLQTMQYMETKMSKSYNEELLWRRNLVVNKAS